MGSEQSRSVLLAKREMRGERERERERQQLRAKQKEKYCPNKDGNIYQKERAPECDVKS